jgi:hypothetical protein
VSVENPEAWHGIRNDDYDDDDYDDHHQSPGLSQAPSPFLCFQVSNKNLKSSCHYFFRFNVK